MAKKENHAPNLPSGRVIAIIIIIILILGFIIFRDQIKVFINTILGPIIGSGAQPSEGYDISW